MDGDGRPVRSARALSSPCANIVTVTWNSGAAPWPGSLTTITKTVICWSASRARGRSEEPTSSFAGRIVARVHVTGSDRGHLRCFNLPTPHPNGRIMHGGSGRSAPGSQGLEFHTLNKAPPGHNSESSDPAGSGPR